MNTYKPTTVGFVFLILSFTNSFAQNQWFKFGITESGVYKITALEARQKGFQDLSELAFFGYPSMLPQKLDSAQLSLQEIPSWKSTDALYVFLEGPKHIELSETGSVQLLNHIYTDTLYYVLGKSTGPQRILELEGSPNSPDGGLPFYSFKILKEEKTNLLNSGRSWYSDPIRQGQSLAVNFGVSSNSSSPWLLKTKLMSQSESPSQMRIFSGNEQVSTIDFNPIPNSIYGIKGREEFLQIEFIPAGNRLNQLRFSFQGTGAGFLDYVAVGIPVSIENLSDGIYFSQKASPVFLPNGKQLWEISDFFKPVFFTSGKSATGKKWVVFSPSSTKTITKLIPLPKQLYPVSEAELLIITSPQFLQAANRLKAHKESLGIPTEVIGISTIFDWYGYGNKDITAIRNFLAKTYQEGKSLKNVLILGKGTFDYKGKLGGRPNLIPIYTSVSSLDPLTTFSSDDYFALLDWGQGIWEESKEGDEQLKIGIGRIPAINSREASTWVEKVIHYEKEGFYDFPSNMLTFLADDGDNSIHMRDAEVHAEYLKKNHPFYRSQKLYLDQFEQPKTGNTQKSPTAKEALEEIIERGTLILNYIGHGNETTLTAEEIFKIQDIENWKQQTPLPLWVTATCEFGRHDSPFLRSAAEELLFADRKGAIGLLSTGRPVFSSVNFKLNQAFIEEVFKSEDGFGQDLGTIFRNTKNLSLNGPLNRNFSLLGDPSLTLISPELKVKVEQLLDLRTGNPKDSLGSLDQVDLIGVISDPLTEALIPNFDGKFRVELWDRPFKQKTKGDENSPFEFESEINLLFRGEGEVKNGKFSARVIIPELANKEPGELKFRISALDIGKNTYAGGGRKIELREKKDMPTSTDGESPEIRIQIQGSEQTNYLIATRQVEITANFSDQSGIYISSENPEKTLYFRVNQNNPIYINQNYKALEGDFTKGEAKFLVRGLQEGVNEIELVAWDNAGNKGQLRFIIEVKGSDQIKIMEHQVFPNPASEQTTFNFRHNRPGENFEATLEVYNSIGQILFSETVRFVKAEESIQGWNWIFFQTKTKYPAKGTYIYKLSLKSELGLDSDTVSGKLLIQ